MIAQVSLDCVAVVSAQTLLEARTHQFTSRRCHMGETPLTENLSQVGRELRSTTQAFESSLPGRMRFQLTSRGS